MSAKIGNRDLFPNLHARAYTNHAAISPPCEPVIAAATAVMTDYARHGVDAFLRWNERRDALRDTLGQLLNAQASDIAFAANTTRALTDVALCLPWKKGDRIVLTAGEFPANITPWQRAAEMFELEIVWLPQPQADTVLGTWIDALRIALERGARLVALSAVQFQTGLRMPLLTVGELCRAHGAELCVDAIQACGVAPIDVQELRIDYLAAGSHKWLMGLEGIALLYVAPSSAARLRPNVAGWLSHDNALSFLFEGAGHLRYDRPFQSGARMFEGGMYNTVGCAALAASVQIILELGVDSIFAHVDAYTSALQNALVPLGFTSHRAGELALRSGVASFSPPKDVAITQLHAAIDLSVVSCAIPDGHLRFSPHWPNARREVVLIAAEIERALASVRG